MKVEYTGRQTTITKKLKLQAEEGLAQIETIVGSACSAHIILSTDKYRQIAEVALKCKARNLVATCESTEMLVALHDSLAKIEQQAIRHSQRRTTIKRHPKGDLKETRSKSTAEPVAPAPTKVVAAKAAVKNSNGRRAVPMLVHTFPSKSPLVEPHVVRTLDHTALRPMSLEEAVKEAAFRDKDVFVFRDRGGLMMVLHRKRDGKVELIELP
jgi:putative sigma-54 modulation protein